VPAKVVLAAATTTKAANSLKAFIPRIPTGSIAIAAGSYDRGVAFH
jgi:hypothetical protein